MAGIEPLERELFEQNRRAKNIEHPDAVAFDALVSLVERVIRGSHHATATECDDRAEPTHQAGHSADP